MARDSKQKNEDCSIQSPQVIIIPYTIEEALRKSVILPPIPPPPPEKPCRCRELWKPKKKKKKKKKRVIPADVLERLMLAKYILNYPFKIYPSNPCRYFPHKLEIFINEINRNPELGLERIVQIEEKNHLYLKYAILAKRIGAWDAVKSCCPFCSCEYFCDCTSIKYKYRDAFRKLDRVADTLKYDRRVESIYHPMYIMYKQLEDPWPMDAYNAMYHPSRLHVDKDSLVSANGTEN